MKNSIYGLPVYLVFLTMISISACSPPGTAPSHVTLSDLVGLWNSSESAGTQSDVIYTRITSDGAIIEYDFDGDDIDKGLNCYQIDSGSVAHIEANHFLITADMHEKNQFKVELELLDAGHALKIYFLDSNDPAKTLKSQIWTRIADETLLDDEPSCRND